MLIENFKHIIFRSAEVALEHFKEKYPDEDPFIRVVCMRKYKNVDSDTKLVEKNWRKIEVTNDSRVETLIPKKELTMRVAEIPDMSSRATTRVNRKLKDLVNTKNSADHKSKLDQLSRQLNIKERVIDCDPSLEVVIDSVHRDYQTTLFIKDVVGVVEMKIHSTEELKIPVGTVLPHDNAGNIERTLMKPIIEDFDKVKKLQQELFDTRTMLEDTRIKLQTCQRIVDDVPIIGKSDLLNQVKSMGRLCDDLKEYVNKGLKTILRESRESVESMSRLVDTKLTCNDNEYKSLLEGKTTKEIVEKYVAIQSKLNRLQSYVCNKYKSFKVDFAEDLKKDGFILTMITFLEMLNELNYSPGGFYESSDDD